MFFIYWYDYVLLPIYLGFMVLMLNVYFRRKYGFNPALKKHFNRGLMIKLVGCVAIAMIYEYYYQGSYDGRFYFECAKMLTGYWSDHPSQVFPVLRNSVVEFNQTNLAGLNLEQVWIFADESFAVGKITALFNILSFNAFLPCSLFFCTFSFIAIWNLFIFFHREFDLNLQLSGLATLYIPSILIWSSSIFKDTITFTALCWLFMCGYYAFVKPRRVLLNIFFFLLCAYIISVIKVYILAAFVPFFIIYVFNSYKARINNPTLKLLSTPFILAISLSGVFLFLENAEALLGRYSLGQVIETATMTSKYIAEVQAGSNYTMNVDFSSPLGLLAAIPAGINVTLFRPYPWEYLKPFTLLASAESMVILYYTVKIIRKLGIGKTAKMVWRTPILMLCLTFSFLFAFMVGISSSNFGSLVRYKIPCLPFYCLFLVMLYKAAYLKPKPVVKAAPARVPEPA